MVGAMLAFAVSISVQNIYISTKVTCKIFGDSNC